MKQTTEAAIKPRSSDYSLPQDPDQLTVAHLAALKPSDKRVDRLVGKGLVLRIQPSGKISFRYVYRNQGRQRAVTVGSYPGEPLKN